MPCEVLYCWPLLHEIGLMSTVIRKERKVDLRFDIQLSMYVHVPQLSVNACARVLCKYTCVGTLCTHLFCLGSFKRLGS